MEYFNEIVGYENVKEELETICSFFKNKNLNKDLIKLPKGVILYGSPGCGKTLFLKEYCKMTPQHIIVIEGISDNIIDELTNAFKEAKYVGNSVIVIDELDLLINKNRQVVRILQSFLDGFDDYKDVFVIATTNSLNNIDSSLLREGRFDRKIKIDYPNEKTRKELIDYYVNKLDASATIDSTFLSKIMEDRSCSFIQTIVNDCKLRFNKITTENLEYSFKIISYGVVFHYEQKDFNKTIAYHEAGHVLLVYKYQNYYKFYKAYLNTSDDTDNGMVEMSLKEGCRSLEAIVAGIEIDIAGFFSSLVMLKIKDNGSMNDLQNAIYKARVLVNSYGYKMPRNVLRKYGTYEVRNETIINCHRNEKYAKKIMKKCEGKVKKYIKHNKKKVNLIAEKLYEKGFISEHELIDIMEGN